jgi:hypothetical protein
MVFTWVCANVKYFSHIYLFAYFFRRLDFSTDLTKHKLEPHEPVFILHRLLIRQCGSIDATQTLLNSFINFHRSAGMPPVAWVFSNYWNEPWWLDLPESVESIIVCCEANSDQALCTTHCSRACFRC